MVWQSLRPGAPAMLLPLALCARAMVVGAAADPAALRDQPPVGHREQQIGGSGGSPDPPGPLLEPPGPRLTHLHTVYIANFEWLPTRLNPLAERTCFAQALDHPRQIDEELPGFSDFGDQVYEGALSFVTAISAQYRDSP